MSQEQTHQSPDPRHLAAQMGMGFVYHDKRKRQLAVDAFAIVDKFQFRHVSEEVAREAAKAYVDALWVKDDIEDSCRIDGELDPEALEAADWSPLRKACERRASLVGIDQEYAQLTTDAWRLHKTGGDYWTPFQKAQMYELQTVLQNPDYPNKPRDGRSGYGPEPVRYVLGVELHDTRRYEEGIEAMAPYYERIIQRHENHNSEKWDVSGRDTTYRIGQGT